MKVVILCGVSGAGKTTYAMKNYPDGVGCSADDFFMEAGGYKFNPSKLGEAHGQCLRKFVVFLTNKVPLVVVDNTNTSVIEIAPYAALALAYGYELEIKILKVDVETAAARNLHGVPKNAIVKMAERLAGLKEALPPWWPCEIVE